MGRKYDFKAAKSFTLGLQELAWLAKYSAEKKMKASEVVNNLIRKAMQKDNKEEKEQKLRGPLAFCTQCMKRTEFKQVKDEQLLEHWLCFECGEDKTEVIEYHIARS
jgi:ribosomal protein L10